MQEAVQWYGFFRIPEGFSFLDGMTSSSEAHDSACSGDDEEDTGKSNHRKQAINLFIRFLNVLFQMYKKRRGDLGKKRELAAIRPKGIVL